METPHFQGKLSHRPVLQWEKKKKTYHPLEKNPRTFPLCLNGISCIFPCVHCLLSSYSHFFIFEVLCWTLSSLLMSYLYWGAQHRTQYSRWVQGEYQLPLPASNALSHAALNAFDFFVFHKTTLLVHGKFGAHQAKSFSATLISRWSTSRFFWWVGLVLSKCRILHLPLVRFMRLLLVHFLPRHLQVVIHSSGLSTTLLMLFEETIYPNIQVTKKDVK